LDVTKPDLGFVRVNFEQSRTWYNADGGYYRPGNVYYPRRDDALELDRGEFTFEAGLTLEKYPKVTFRYSHLYRDGEKGSTSWGQTHPTLSSLVRGIAPGFYDIDETRDIFALDVSHKIKKTDFGIGLRYETGDFDNSRYFTQWPGEPAVQRQVTQREGTSYDFFSVHAFTETWLKKNLCFSTGFLFSQYDSDVSGSRIYGDDFDVSYAPNALNGLGFEDLRGSLDKQEYVANLNLMAIPFKNLTIVPSIRVQSQDWDGDMSALRTLGSGAPTPSAADSDGDALDVTERLDVRYTGFTNWVLYARGEWNQGDGELQENGGLGQTAPVQRKTDNERFFQKYTAGVRWYPARIVSVDLGGYYKNNSYDYDHRLDSTANTGASGNRYPAYLTMHEFETFDGNVRLTLRPHAKVSLVSRYEFQSSTVQTRPDATSGLSEVESSEMTSHIFAQNVSWTPWSRLYLQAGFNYVNSETETPTSKSTQAVLDAQNNYWTANFNASLVLDDKTDLNLGYFYYESDNFDDNSATGLPLGLTAREHGVTATIVRRLTEKIRLTLRYGYFNFDEDTYGGNQNYEAHALFTGLQWRF
jgi:hypothetical protein